MQNEMKTPIKHPHENSIKKESDTKNDEKCFNMHKLCGFDIFSERYLSFLNISSLIYLQIFTLYFSKKANSCDSFCGKKVGSKSCNSSQTNHNNLIFHA